MEIFEVFFSKIGLLRGQERWKEWMVKEIFKVQEFCSLLLLTTGKTLLIQFFNGLGFFIISVQEVINPFNFWHFKLDWEFKHKNILIINTIDIKNCIKEVFERLVLIKLSSKSQG